MVKKIMKGEKIMKYGADDWGSSSEDDDEDVFDLLNSRMNWEFPKIPKINYQLYLGIFLGIFLGKRIL